MNTDELFLTPLMWRPVPASPAAPNEALRQSVRQMLFKMALLSTTVEIARQAKPILEETDALIKRAETAQRSGRRG